MERVAEVVVLEGVRIDLVGDRLRFEADFGIFDFLTGEMVRLGGASATGLGDRRPRSSDGVGTCESKALDASEVIEAVSYRKSGERVVGGC